MKTTVLGQWVLALTALALVGAALAGAGWLFLRAIEKGATVLGASLAACATVAAAVVVRYFERRKETEAARREHLGRLYEEVASAMAGDLKTGRAMDKTITQFRRKVLVYASPAVLEGFRTWSQNLPADDARRSAERASALRFEALVKAMRKDLGTSNWMLQEGDLLRTMLNDFDEYYGEPELPVQPPKLEGEPRVSVQRSGSRQ